MKISKRLNLIAAALAVALGNAVDWLRGSTTTRHYGMRYGFKNAAVSTQEFQLDVSLDDGATWTEIKQITDIVDPTGEAADLDASNLKSPGVKEYIAGLRDSASVNITGQRVRADAGQNILRDNQGVVAKFKNTYSDGEVLTYSATIKSFRITGGTDAVMMFTSAIRGSANTWTTT
jgi:hypothetical protein